MKKRRKNKRAKRTDKGFGFIYSIFIRYLILLIAALPSFWIFYFVFTPLTLYPVYLILSLFFDITISGTTIFLFLGDFVHPIEIVDACIAGSAYYLLLIFNLSIPNIKLSKTLKMIGFAFLSFLIINVFRIVILSAIFILKPGLFDISHKLSWYIGSIILVVGIWFLEVKKFKIKEIPFYSDVKSISKHIK